MTSKSSLMAGAAAIAMIFAMPQAAWSQTATGQQEEVPAVELPDITW